jgi:hypothetical protein
MVARDVEQELDVAAPAGDPFARPGLEPGLGLLQDAEQELALGGEVVQQPGLADPGLGGDRGDRRAAEALLGERAHGDLQDLLPAGLAARLPRARHGPHSTTSGPGRPKATRPAFTSPGEISRPCRPAC